MSCHHHPEGFFLQVFADLFPEQFLVDRVIDFDVYSRFLVGHSVFGHHFENINSLNPDLIVVTEDGITQQDFNVRY